MDMSSSIKLKPGINVTDLSGEKVMIDFETGKYYMIKGVGNDIWDRIQTETTVSDLVASLLAEYEVSEEECKTSVIAFLEKLEELNFLA
ncbi:lasso peptide biosynthesis PqqD family chaperone [Butyrivibrio sp. MC2013]|uniref:lasso peptide biosynthesis PqqD family chaperone n=1 Tax=Butyrivibrio sp. MC2013 TaxID=1280686 RepID=UPI0003FD7C03|nr:lasso peptide biosynthesis PqqD family chaperone [Butyrivibrio sp. MC2013]